MYNAAISKKERDKFIPEIKTFVLEEFYIEIGECEAEHLLDFVAEKISSTANRN